MPTSTLSRLTISGLLIAICISTTYSQNIKLTGEVTIQRSASGMRVPLPDAGIEIHRIETKQIYMTLTNKEGVYTYEGLPEDGTYVILVSAKDAAPTSSIVNLKRSANYDFTLRPGNGRKLTLGEVYDPKGFNMPRLVSKPTDISELRKAYEAVKYSGDLKKIVPPVINPILTTPVRAYKPELPINFSQEDNFGDFHMITHGVLSENGQLTVRTETNNHVAFKGNCGTVAAWLFDRKGNVLMTIGNLQFCVDGSACFFCSSSQRFDTWNAKIEADVLSRVRGISVLHGRGSKNVFELTESNVAAAWATVKRIKEIVDQ